MVTGERAARDSLRQQIAFLGMAERPRFTDDVRMAIYECAEELGALTRQMDAGQRGKGVPFDEVPHVMVRMCVAACILAMSGKLEELEAE
ncbi:hypothetical protein [Adlercreutzia sp.]|uniref:hypothetical protein n=1 Tax=Adlercreutzia sp. TaxID=1872387 RepID=UPI003AB3DFBF